MKKIFIIIISLICTGCATQYYSVVGSFDDDNEVFIGQIENNVWNRRQYIEVQSLKNNIICAGDSHDTEQSSSMFSCAGYAGKAILKCEDGRTVESTWELVKSVSGCTGIGKGYDSEGNNFRYLFGMSEEEALSILKREYNIPDANLTGSKGKLKKFEQKLNPQKNWDGFWEDVGALGVLALYAYVEAENQRAINAQRNQAYVNAYYSQFIKNYNSLSVQNERNTINITDNLQQPMIVSTSLSNNSVRSNLAPVSSSKNVQIGKERLGAIGALMGNNQILVNNESAIVLGGAHKRRVDFDRGGGLDIIGSGRKHSILFDSGGQAEAFSYKSGKQNILFDDGSSADIFGRNVIFDDGTSCILDADGSFDCR